MRSASHPALLFWCASTAFWIAVGAPSVAGQTSWRNVTTGGVLKHSAAWDPARSRTVLFDGLATDVLEWDGTNWHVSSAPGPVYRYGFALAHDSARRMTVLFGGGKSTRFGPTEHDDTWEWDGSQWLQRSPAVKPPARWDHAMAYDAARGVVVLFGGSLLYGGSFTDTWEWDGTNWSNRTPATSPPAGDAAMTYDAVRRRTVLFTDDSTWAWDGVSWQQLATPVTPGVRFGHQLAHDPIRGRTVLFGGFSPSLGLVNDTWELDGSTWTQRFSANKPAARSDYAMAYDAARGRVVLHGGYDNSSPGTALDDLWEWDGNDWIVRRSPGPRPDGSVGVAFDEVRQRVILFNGYDGGSPHNRNAETWEWDGQSWRLLHPVTVPSAFSSFMLAADTSRGEIVRFGGLGFPSVYTDETWVWDGVDWSQATPLNRPAGRIVGALAHDPGRARTVLFGGATISGLDGTTWEWDGSDWTNVNPPTSPSPRGAAALGYHGASGRMILFGGNTGPGNSGETWAFDGLTWQQLFPASSPPPDSGSMIEDPARGRLVYVASGGTWEWNGANWAQQASSGPRRRGALAYDVLRERVVAAETFNWDTMRTWEWFSPFQARYAPFGQGCAGTAGVPELSAVAGGRPWLGDVLQIELDRIPTGNTGALVTGASNTTWGGVRLPLDLTPFGFVGCRLWTSAEILLPAVSSQGVARWSLPIPANPALLGAEIFQQGLVIDPLANPAGIVVSNAVRATIGAR